MTAKHRRLEPVGWHVDVDGHRVGYVPGREPPEFRFGVDRPPWVSPETFMWTRCNASSGEFAELRARGVRLQRSFGEYALIRRMTHRIFGWRKP